MLVIVLLATLTEITFSSNVMPRKTNLVHTASSDFSITVQTASFVDKTAMIKEFMEGYETIMITAPRRIGKSTNLDMIKRFSEVTVDEKGNRVPTNLTTNYELFTRNNLNIYKYNRVFFDNHFGKFPVIHLDFKMLSCNSYKSFIITFKILIRDIYMSYAYLLHSSTFDEEHKHDFNKFYKSAIIKKLKDEELLDSAETLSFLLYTHFEKTKCIVLIDEYDGPIQKAIFDSGTDIELIFTFIRKFISITFKSNPYVQRGLLWACIGLGSVISTDANNIIHIPFLAVDKYCKFHGFTEEEVKSLLDKQKMLGEFDNVKMWYDGYYVRNSNITIYNTFSIVNYLYSKKFDNYWVKSGYIKHLEKIFLNKNVGRKIYQLLLENTTSILAVDGINIEHILKLKSIVDKPQSLELSHNDADLFIQFMTDLGYFNVVYRGKKTIVVEIPNLEIEKEIESSLYSVSFFKEKLHINQKNIDFYVNALLELGKNETTFLTFAISVANLHSALPRMPENERYFQYALYAFPEFSYKFMIVVSEIRVERKRFDLLVIRNDLTAIIIVLKYEDGSGYNALVQIIEKKYYNVLKQYEFLQIKKYILVGLYVTKIKRCDMSYIINSTDIKNAKNVSAFYV